MKKLLVGIALLLIVISPVLAQETSSTLPELEMITSENASQLQPIGRVGRGWISDLAWSFNSHLLAVANAAGVWLYDMNALTQEKQFLKMDDVSHITFNSTSSMLVAGNPNGDIQLWNIENNLPVLKIKSQQNPINSLAFSPKGEWIASGSGNAEAENTLNIWNTTTGESVFTYETLATLENLIFSPDGKWLAISETSNETLSVVHLWLIENNSLIEAGTLEGGKNYLYFSSDSSLIAAVSDNEISVWNINSHKLVSKFATKSPVRAVALGQRGQGNALFAFDDLGLYIWDIATNTAIKEQSGEDCCYSLSRFQIVFSPDAQQFAVITYPENLSLESKIEIFDTVSGQLLNNIGGFGEPRAMVFGPNRSLAVVEPDKHTVRLWDTDFTSGGRVVHFEENITGLASDRFKIVALTSDDDLINMRFFHVIDLKTETEFIAHSIDFDMRQPASVALIPNGSLLAIGDCETPFEFYNQCDKGRVELRDTITGDIVRILEGHSGAVIRLLFSHDGSLLASAQVSNNGEVRIWDVLSGNLLTQVRGHQITLDALSFSPNGKIIATGGCDEAPGPCTRGDIILWDAHSGEQLGVLVGHTNNVFDVAFSPDGSLLVSSSHEGEIRLWDVQDRSTIVTRQNNTYTLRMKLSDDGTLLAVTRLDGVIQLWGVPAN